MVTLALIGVGNWGKNYLHTANAIKNVEIKYICAQTQQRLITLPSNYIKTISIVDLLKIKEIDGFIIATPASTHFSLAKQCLSSGRNLLIEKPLTTDYGQALELQKIWQMRKPLVLVGHTYLYNPAYQAVKKLFKTMKDVRSIHFEGLVSPVRSDISVIWDWGPHPVSLLLDMIKQPITEIQAIGTIENPSSSIYDTVKANLKFRNNIEAVIHISWFGPVKSRKLTILGKYQKIELDDTNTTHQKISLYKNCSIVQFPKYQTDTPLTNEIIEFIEAIKGSKKITSDIKMGVNVVKVLSAIEQSVENGGRSIKFDLFKNN